VALEIESCDGPVLDGERVRLALRVEDEPIRPQLRLGLDRVGEFFLRLRRSLCHDFAGQFAQRMSLDGDLEGLVIAERRRRHVVSAGAEFFLEGREEFLSAVWGGEGGAQMGVWIQDDSPGPHLVRDILDILGGGLRGANRIRFIPFLRADEADEGLFGPSVARLLRKIREALDGFLFHLVLEVVDMEEQDAHLGPRYPSRV